MIKQIPDPESTVNVFAGSPDAWGEIPCTSSEAAEYMEEWENIISHSFSDAAGNSWYTPFVFDTPITTRYLVISNAGSGNLAGIQKLIVYGS